MPRALRLELRVLRGENSLLVPFVRFKSLQEFILSEAEGLRTSFVVKSLFSVNSVSLR